MMRPGRLYGVGVGPGDPDLMTVKARRLIEQSPVLAYPIAGTPSARGVARTIAEPFFTEAHTLVPMVYPVTTAAPITPAAMRARSPTSTMPPPPSSPRTSTPAEMSSCSARATRSSTAPTCTSMSGSPTATRPRSSPA